MRRFPKHRRMHGGAAVPIRVMDYERFVCGRRLGGHSEGSGTALNGAQGRDMAVVKQEKRSMVDYNTKNPHAVVSNNDGTATCYDLCQITRGYSST